MTSKSELKKATRAVKMAFAPDPQAAGDTDVLDTLKKEHAEVKDLLSALQEAETASLRNRLVKQIKAALVPHTKAEEKVVYDAVIALRDKKSQIDGHEGYLEHALAAKTLQTLASLRNSTSSAHRATAKVLKELVEHHIDEEEKNIWSDVKTSFPEDDRKRMNLKYLAAKSKVRIS